MDASFYSLVYCLARDGRFSHIYGAGERRAWYFWYSAKNVTIARGSYEQKKRRTRNSHSYVDGISWIHHNYLVYFMQHALMGGMTSLWVYYARNGASTMVSAARKYAKHAAAILKTTGGF